MALLPSPSPLTWMLQQHRSAHTAAAVHASMRLVFVAWRVCHIIYKAVLPSLSSEATIKSCRKLQGRLPLTPLAKHSQAQPLLQRHDLKCRGKPEPLAASAAWGSMPSLHQQRAQVARQSHGALLTSPSTSC